MTCSSPSLALTRTDCLPTTGSAAGVVLFDLCCQLPKYLYLTVLFELFFAHPLVPFPDLFAVLYKFTGYTAYDAFLQINLCFQHVQMIVHMFCFRPFVITPFQAIFVDPFVTRIGLGSARYDQLSFLISGILNAPAAYQAIHHLMDHFFHFPGSKTLQILVFRHMVGQVFSFCASH